MRKLCLIIYLAISSFAKHLGNIPTFDELCTVHAVLHLNNAETARL